MMDRSAFGSSWLCFASFAFLLGFGVLLLWFTTAYFSSVLLEMDEEDLLIRILQHFL
jgi:hypothetical protein